MDNTWRKSALTIVSKQPPHLRMKKLFGRRLVSQVWRIPWKSAFAQFEFDLDLDTIHEQDEAILDSTLKNNKVEEEEEQTEVLEEPHWEKEESTETSSTSAHILDVPRAQERSWLGLCDEQIEDIKIEKLFESSSYFIPVHDEKLFEKTQSGPPQYIDNRNPPAMERHHSLWCKRRKD
jgi:hypothetical protein